MNNEFPPQADLPGAKIEQPAGQEEIILRGIPASPGIAIGKVVVLKKDGVVVHEKSIDDPSVELERLKKAIERSAAEWIKFTIPRWKSSARTRQ